MPLLQITGFHKRYRRQVAVERVDLSVGRGEIFGLIGPDGAGKSSLMKAAAGVLSYEGGLIEAFGVPLDSETNAERVKDRIGFMPQGLGLNLYPDLSVEENIDFLARLREVAPADLARRKRRLLAMTRLERFRGRAMKHLSGGMKQKLGLVCTLIHQPELVILDEPTTGVDPLSRRDFWAILTDLLRDRGITALVSTAYLDEASRFHRLALLHQGQVLDQGTPEEIVSRVPGRLLSFRTSQPGEALRRLQGRYRQLDYDGHRIRVFVTATGEAAALDELRRHLGDLPVRQLEAGEPGLEDVFVALLRGRGDADREGVPRLPVNGRSHRGGEDEVLIEASGLCRDFGDFRAVDRVGFRVRRGEIFGLLGANGAGKTTVIKMLTGILRPTAGSGRVAGADMRRAAGAIRQRIGYMSQSFSLYRDLTALENIRLYGGIYGLGPGLLQERIDWVLEMAGIRGHESDRTAALPMGLRQRLALGCALVHRPQVLFLDEPTSGVDPLGRRRFWSILTHLAREQGVAILITTHYMSEAEHCDHLALMHAGRLVADKTPDALRRELQQEVGELLELQLDHPLEALERLEGQFKGVTLHGNRIHLFAPSLSAAEPVIRRLLADTGVELRSLRTRVPGMEDVFVYRMGLLEREAA
ncbi:MAG TPA: ABC transporter ATP-binding protein [Sedimenticola thiotaurini]|uniref:ABC transporter ATP-binding protein n=1 Tax=Sedimenticola thiotaurini TaxID=1543721 RepID=A0A831RL95_9GAMM|nr:ABC transporter ATP-binding protein [Sedimenticola thiotaurini]